jgi:hypothetical protein
LAIIASSLPETKASVLSLRASIVIHFKDFILHCYSCQVNQLMH